MKCYVKKLFIFHSFRVFCFLENAENAPNDKVKITRTEKETKMIELQNYKSRSYNCLE